MGRSKKQAFSDTTETHDNIRGPETIGQSPGTCVLLQDFKTIEARWNPHEAVLVANGFQDHFVSIYADSLDGPHPISFPRQYDTALWQVTFETADAGKFLKQVNHYSAMGPDNINPRILKEAADTLALPLFPQQHGKRCTSHPSINLVNTTHLLATAPLVSPAYHAKF